MQHKLELADPILPPVREPLRRHPAAYLDLIDQDVGKLISARLLFLLQLQGAVMLY
jgi:hypothetical protein